MNNEHESTASAANAAPAGANTPRGPLDGLLVVEIASVVMGPFAGRQLAKLGAEVVRVESPAGDVLRKSAKARHPGMAPTAMNLSDGKRNISLDFSDPEQLAVLKRLIGVADVVLTNYLPRQRARFGFDWDTVRQVNPRCVLVTAQGFASESARADDPAYDDTIQAASGISDVYRISTGVPKYAPYIVADKVCGLSIVYSALAAVYRRERTGAGQWVDVPMFDVMADFNMLEQLNEYAFVPPLGEAGWHRTTNPARRPHTTTDGSVCIMPYTDKNWRHFLELAGRITDADQEAPYPTNADRNAHVEETQGLIADYARTRSTDQVVEECHAIGIPAQKVNSVEDLVHDEYLRERQTVTQIEHPTEGAMWRTTPNFGFSESPLQPVGFAQDIDGDHDAIVDMIAAKESERKQPRS